jgi:hypothetical protein
VSATVRHLRAVNTTEHDWSVPWVSRRQLADHLGFSPRWVSEQVANGAPCERIGGSLRFQIPAFTEWVIRRGAK